MDTLQWWDYMHEWCQRKDFRAALPPLLAGEDPGFVATIRRIAEAAVADKTGRPQI
jgi:hypothetical protein